MVGIGSAHALTQWLEDSCGSIDEVAKRHETLTEGLIRVGTVRLSGVGPRDYPLPHQATVGSNI